jgi:hypothetical protein
VQRAQLRVAGQLHLAREALEQVRPPLAQVGDARGHPLRMQGDAQHVGRRGQQVLGHAGGQQRDAGVAGQQLPVAVDDDRGVRLDPGQHLLDRLAHRFHVGVLQGALLVDGGVAGGQQQLVALAQRDLQLLGQGQQHLRAGARAAGLHEAEVPRGHPHLEGEVHLAQAPSPAPVAQQRADAHARGRVGHGDDRTPRRARAPFPVR